MRRLQNSHNANNLTSFFTLCFLRYFSQATYKRKIHSYHAYPTPAKGDLIPLRKNASPIQQVNRYAKHIRYHAEWRANLFFLLCIAYYKKNRIVNMGRTKLQHGRGIKPHLQACHSSILPSLIDFNQTRQSVVKSHASMIDHTLLDNWNNMTVLCPHIVNESDFFLEGYYGTTSIHRKRLLATLCVISFGLCDPMIGMQCFYQIMQHAFNTLMKRMQIDTIPERDTLYRVFYLQKQGTFRHMSKEAYLPKERFVKKVLAQKPHETREEAYKRMQKILLTGDKKAAHELLLRFQ